MAVVFEYGKIRFFIPAASGGLPDEESASVFDFDKLLKHCPLLHTLS
jgi:hypothetical protein